MSSAVRIDDFEPRVCSSVRMSLRTAELRAQTLGFAVYQCPHCAGHHLTNAARWTRRERARRKKAQQRMRRTLRRCRS